MTTKSVRSVGRLSRTVQSVGRLGRKAKKAARTDSHQHHDLTFNSNSEYVSSICLLIFQKKATKITNPKRMTIFTFHISGLIRIATKLTSQKNNPRRLTILC
ncbi:hypothetical protein BpHYR1_011089 [Brachionus plicatilis]|uniref:Uncharacterized protein n=1 Tax=Brachionus plicatilis TaxID=10195 RepID=A0A3M7RYC6_BRAPC|nr:hypothetical protein BpHYR1_011089 [Brachionus plicatilis]